MKALLLRVGIDKAYGALSPVFNDETFIYIPIYNRDIKEKEINEKRTYNDYEDLTDLSLSEYIPQNIWNNIIHLDPEFKTFTYGDPAINKRKAILSLKKGDFLVFYMGGKEIEGDGEEGCYIFGYFKVEKVLNWDKVKESEIKKFERTFKNNAHIISSKSRDNLVLVKGNSSKSKLLKNCIKISKKNPESNNPSYIATNEMQNYLGIRKHITRAIPILIKEKKHIINLKELLGIKKTVILNDYTTKSVSYSHFCRIVKRDKILNKNEKLLLTNFFAYIPRDISDSDNIANFLSDMSYPEYIHEDRLMNYFDIFYKNIIDFDE